MLHCLSKIIYHLIGEPITPKDKLLILAASQMFFKRGALLTNEEKNSAETELPKNVLTILRSHPIWQASNAAVLVADIENQLNPMHR